MKFLKLRYFYLIAIFFLLFLYLFPTILHVEGQREWTNIYFGNLVYLLFFVFLLYGIRMWITEIGGKIAFEIRIFLFLLCFLSALYLLLLYQVGVTLETVSISEEMKNQLLNLSIYRYHLGLIAAFGLYSLANLGQYPFYYYSYALIGIFSFCFFLLIYKPIQKRIKNYFRVKRERRRREREEKLLQEQMQIKKALEREEYRKKLQFEQRKTEIIQEKAKDFEMGQLISSVDLLEEEEVVSESLFVDLEKEENTRETAEIEEVENENNIEVEEE